MARASAESGRAQADRATPRGTLPETMHTGVNARATKTVIVSALLEVTGQVRFGDGTDMATTITEKDTILGLDGNNVEKAIWAGTKRRGVDRRTIHELRDRAGWTGDCYIPRLCGMCPTCWLFGFTGTTQEQSSEVKGINAKSRILYAASASIQGTTQCLNRHSRNQVDEKAQICWDS
jgi:Csc2 Crispr